jgi:hypothetical protein
MEPHTPEDELPIDQSLPDFDELDKKDLTEESLQEELNKYRKAYQEEFESTVSNEGLENIEEYTREFFKKNITTAAAQIVFLSGNGETDSIKLRASKMVVDLALADAAADGDPIKQFLKSLQKSPTATPPEIIK